MNTLVKHEQQSDLTTIQDVKNQSANIMSIIVQLSGNPNADVAKMEKLMDLYERQQKKEALEAYAQDMIAMQSEMPRITKDAEIKHGDKVIASYAKYETIFDYITPIMQKYGFSFTFTQTTDSANKWMLDGKLWHRGGHCETSRFILEKEDSGKKGNLQQIGSAISYAKRYLVCEMLNLIIEGQDDDGNTASKGPTISQEQIDTLQDWLNSTNSDEKRFLHFAGVNKLSEIPATKYDTLLATVKAKAKV